MTPQTLRSDFLEKNLAALDRGGQHLALDWLRGAAPGQAVTEVAGADGRPVLLVGGQSQASRHDPEKEASLWLEKARAQGAEIRSGSLLLFGFGSPWPAELILRKKPVSVFEPDPGVVRAVLGFHDFQTALAAPAGTGLTLLTPWHLARDQGGWRGLTLLVHPPAQRRAAGHLANLRRLLTGPRRRLNPASGAESRIMVVPPLSGGSWPVAASLARAVETAGHPLLFLDWEARLKDMERAAHQARPADAQRLTARIFAEAGLAAAQAGQKFQPDVILALAQAPLDTAALTRLREHSDALLAFWLVEDARFFRYVAEVAPVYDALFHIQAGLAEPMARDWGLSEAHYLPLAADPDLFRPLATESVAEAYQAELSFMGAGYPNRRRLLTALARDFWPRTGRPAEAFKVFGSGWGGADPELRGHLFDQGRRVSQLECALIYAGGLVNLNIHASGHPSPGFDPESRFVNPRTFEIAAAGSLQIVDRRPLLPDLFTAGREVAVAEAPTDLPGLIDHYLRHPEEAAALGRAARQRVLAEHTYGHRLARMLALLGPPDAS